MGKGKQKHHQHKPAHTLSLEEPTGTSQTGVATHSDDPICSLCLDSP